MAAAQEELGNNNTRVLVQSFQIYYFDNQQMLPIFSSYKGT